MPVGCRPVSEARGRRLSMETMQMWMPSKLMLSSRLNFRS